MIVIGLVVSVALMGWAFYEVRLGPPFQLVPRFSMSGWLTSLPSHVGWLIPFVLLTAALTPLRAVLWGTTLPPPVPSMGTRFLAIALGGLVHNTLPGRLGLLGSAFVLGRRTSIPLPAAFGSLALAKLIEFGDVVLATCLGLLLVRARGVPAPGFGPLVTAGAIVLLVLLVVVAVLARVAPEPPQSGRFLRLRGLAAQVAAGVRSVGSVRRIALCVLVGLGPVTASALAHGLAVNNLGSPAGIAGGVLMLGALTLSQFTPGLPIGAGVHYAVAAWAGRELGLAAEDAATIAVLSHAVTVAVNLAVGVVAALTHRRELPTLLPRRRRAAATTT
jgi:hypothetical protein